MRYKILPRRARTGHADNSRCLMLALNCLRHCSNVLSGLEEGPIILSVFEPSKLLALCLRYAKQKKPVFSLQASFHL